MKKLVVTYHMIRGKETAETCITLPIDEKRYYELERMDNHSDTFEEIKGALERLVSLQRYDRLGSWGYTLEVEVPDTKPPKGTHFCKYCGRVAEGEYEDLLCSECLS